jgi:hypothetical protein
MKSLAFALTTVLLVVIACGDDAPTMPLDASGPAIDAAADALAGITQGETCFPLNEQCQAGLTCRILGEADGVCLPVGTTAEGDICTSASQCGPNMTCVPAELGRWRCVVVCSVEGNIGPPRCGEGVLCQRYWSDSEGYCR